MTFIYTLPEIEHIAAQVWSRFQNYNVWAFFASMGAGKTTFISALCKVIEVEDVVSSPTFAIIHEYKSAIKGTVYHMDWYRLKNEEEAIQAGVEDCIQSGCLCFIEWPERAPGLLPENCLSLKFSILNSTTRKLIIE